MWNTAQAEQLVKQVERVCCVVDEIDAVMVGNQSKERSRSRGWSAAIIDQFLCDLFAAGRDFDDVPIVPVGREDVLIPCKCKAKWIIERSARGNRNARPGRISAEECSGDGCDPVLQAVSHVQNS